MNLLTIEKAVERFTSNEDERIIERKQEGVYTVITTHNAVLDERSKFRFQFIEDEEGDDHAVEIYGWYRGWAKYVGFMKEEDVI